MRRYLLVLPFLFACAKGETPPADSAAPAPAALTEADVAGTWSGTLHPAAGPDSVVLAHWTVVIGGGAYRLTTTENPKDTVSGTYVLEGDSSRYSAGPYADPNAGGAMVTDAGTTRFNGNQISGTGTSRLAAKPDSIVVSYKFSGTKVP